MRLYIVFLIALIICGLQKGYAEVAVLPYKIDNSSVDFPETMGGEYSRLLSVGAIISKQNIEITSPRDIDGDLGRLKINPQEVLTGEDLDLLGKSLRIDYFLTGTLSRKGKGYRSNSIVYSVRDRKIIIRVRVEDEDLFRLAEREIREAFIQYRNKKTAGGNAAGMDAAFLLDMSYGMNYDWPSLKSAIIGFASRCIDTLRLDTRIHVIPFSDRHDAASGAPPASSILTLRKELEALNPSGGASAESFIKSLQHAVQNVRWRSRARKTIIIIANSSIRARAAEKYAVLAQNRGISIVSISLGNITGDQCEAYERLSNIADGPHLHAAYHQKIFNAGAESTELYFQNGRLFKSHYPDSGWAKGLFSAGKSAHGREKPKPFLDEIFYDGKKIPVAPHAMAEAYARLAMEKIINSEKPESNIDSLLNGLPVAGKKSQKAGGSAGKALISDGKISFWIYTNRAGAMAHLENSWKAGHYVPIGVVLKKDPGATYGVALVPLVTNLGPDYIPDVLKARLSDMVKQSDYYLAKGLYYPPVWFVSVKVEAVERLHGKTDIRQR